MSQVVPLCQLPPPPPPGCCDAPTLRQAAPLTIYNPPGLAAISYRIGTFTSFRRAMLDEVARADLLGLSPNPFSAWHEGTDGDYQTIFIELWAYLADILTFYQERIANEAYLGTATQLDSLMRLAELIDYHPGPGAAASGLAAFIVAKGKVVTIPTSFRLGTRATPGKLAATFETSDALTAYAQHSTIPLSTVAPTNQFAQLSSIGSVFGPLGGLTLKAAEEIFGAAGQSYIKTLSTQVETLASSSFAASLPITAAVQAPSVIEMAALAATSLSLSSARLSLENRVLIEPIFRDPGLILFFNQETRGIVLEGTNNKVAAGDYVLTVENEHTSSENPNLHQVSSVSVDKTANTTTITWKEQKGTVYDQTSSPVALYAFGVKASPFGSSAPQWLTLPATLTNSDGQHATGSPLQPHPVPYPTNWDDDHQPNHYVAPGDTLPLDAIYDAVAATPESPNWVALVADNIPGDVGRVTESRPLTLTDYALTSKVIQLSVKFADGLPGSTYPIRKTLVLTGARPLTLHNNLPLPDPLQGDTLILAGLYPNLHDGQAVIVTGNLYSSEGLPTGPTPATEFCVLKGPPLQDLSNLLTIVKLKKPLSNQYSRNSASMYANVVAVKQGETVKDEVLGGGDVSAFQSYPLKKKPLTYLPSTDPEGLSAVQSTLTVTVNGVRWNERPTLLESPPNAQEYTTILDDSGKTTVVFGDGIHGARAPTGVDNIHARYRNGLGISGNVAVGGLAQLIDNVAGVQQVTNPQPTSGGIDQEGINQIRVNAPSSLRTFLRAVSAEDYAALALTYPGIVKASASWVTRDANSKGLAQPYVQLTVATADQIPITQTPLAGQLRNFLDQRRDPNVPMRILNFAPIYVSLTVTVDLYDQYPRQATFAQVLAALNPGTNPDGTAGYFAFSNLKFGENLHLSEIYAIVQGVPGVRDANITTFQIAGQSNVQTDIFIGPTEIAVIANDPANPQTGLLILNQGSGGFADT